MNEIEAISVLETRIKYPNSDTYGGMCEAEYQQEAVVLAIEALREKADFVRCKYCEYWQDNNGGYPHEECRWGHDETPDADDFCSCGRRLEVEHDG